MRILSLALIFLNLLYAQIGNYSASSYSQRAEFSQIEKLYRVLERVNNYYKVKKVDSKIYYFKIVNKKEIEIKESEFEKYRLKHKKK